MGRGKMTFAKALAPSNWLLLDIEGMKATMVNKEGRGLEIKRREKNIRAQRIQLLLSQHEAIYNAALSEFEKSDVKIAAAKVVVQNLETVLEDLLVKILFV